jgi:uncharacterized damage-inducible protein DinB
MSIRAAYSMWPQYNRRLVEVVRDMSPAQLAIRPSPDLSPLWATIGHTAGGRVYWLCGIVGEPGAEQTPFPDAVTGVGWEDDEDTPRSAEELVDALETTFRIVDRCLDEWTFEQLDATVQRPFGDTVQTHTRGSILQRLLTHEAWHCGELSQTLGINRLPQIDLWRAD